jgi:two-component system chemotaxis response regulator CheY
VILAALGGDAPPLLCSPSAAFRSGWEALGFDWGLVASRIAAPAEPASEPAAAATTDAATRVLTIDDSKTIRQMLLLTLQGAGFEVVQAEDGEEGVALLAREPIDFVITDINMPRMDGYGVLRRMRADPQHRATPVLVLTTENEPGNKELARDLGASGWIVKPFDPERLVAAIHAVTAAQPAA